MVNLRTFGGYEQDMGTFEQLVSALRSALRNLYDPNTLCSGELARALSGEGALTFAAIRDLLIRHIEAMEPEVEVPQSAESWRIYEILFYRYVQQSNQRSVAMQMAVSVRHLRRLEKDAIEALAHRLLQEGVIDISGEEEQPYEINNQSVVETAVDNLARMEKDSCGETVDLWKILEEVGRLSKPLATSHGTRVQFTLEDDKPLLVKSSAVILRQALLNLLSVAIRQAPKGQVILSARPANSEIVLEIRLERFSKGPPLSKDDEANLSVSERLLTVSRGKLDYHSDPERGIVFRVRLPSSQQIRVLVIDDDADAFTLLERYSSGSRFSLSGVSDPTQAIAAALEREPHVILLDVLMPTADGWEILGRLKAHPKIADVPLIVCTVLAQKDLALSLGADGFVRKPIGRQRLLMLLDQYVSLR